jgi:hypothetical protein
MPILSLIIWEIMGAIGLLFFSVKRRVSASNGVTSVAQEAKRLVAEDVAIFQNGLKPSPDWAR